MEEYKIIDEYPQYSVSNLGNIKHNKTKKILKKNVDRYGYYYVILSNNGVKKFFRIHRLVGLAFIINPENKLTIDHIDNNKKNNNVNNLRWATHEENYYNKKIYKNNNSGIKGVFFNKKNNKWKAYVCVNKKQIHLGYYENIEDAKQIRQYKANYYYKTFTNSCEKLDEIELMEVYAN